MLRAWETRPRELRALFNPIFCSWLLRETLSEYQSKPNRATGMPMPLIYLILPLLMHYQTRHSLPRTTATSFTSWINEHPEVCIGMAERVQGFYSITGEAIRFGIGVDMICFGDSGNLLARPHRKPRGYRNITSSTAEVQECCSHCVTLGRWFARAPNTVFIINALRLG